MKAFLDANILFSAADPDSATRRLLHAVVRHGVAVTSPHAWEEARRNLVRKRPEHEPRLAELSRIVAVTEAFARPPETGLPPCDVPILAGALGARCSHLWTSDKKHFGRYYGKCLAGVRVVSSIMLADEMASA